MLSLGLVLAFSASALAVDVKFNGSFYAAGMYLDKTSFNKDSYTIPSTTSTQNPGISTAFYYQRLRVGTEFIVSPGLKLVTRFDAMERIWGGVRKDPGIAADTQSAGTRAENENIAFDHAYIQYDSPIGTFKAGYMDDLVWGTVFNDSAQPKGVLAWNYIMGPWNFIAKIIKTTDYSSSAVAPATTTDLDSDKYALAVKYTGKTGEAGLLFAMYRDATKRASNNYTGQYYGLLPYAKAQIGPVKIQAELDYIWGDWSDYESGAGLDDVKLENLGIFVDAVADFGMFYGGGTFAYISGNDPTTDKLEGSALISSGLDWNPCLIMFNQDITYWAGAINGYPAAAVTSNASPMSNAWFYQVKGGVRPMDKLDIMASVAYAYADKKPLGVLNDLYGWEVDVTGTYKLTNNLSYMLGVGYLFTGDYYKGASNANRVNDNYMLINKLTLTF
jgi:hypothetical protein